MDQSLAHEFDLLLIGSSIVAGQWTRVYGRVAKLFERPHIFKGFRDIAGFTFIRQEPLYPLPHLLLFRLKFGVFPLDQITNVEVHGDRRPEANQP